MNNTDATARIIALLNDRAYDDALDMIVDYADLLTVTDADDIMDVAIALDSTSIAGIAAEVRDAIRDNTEHDLIG